MKGRCGVLGIPSGQPGLAGQVVCEIRQEGQGKTQECRAERGLGRARDPAEPLRSRCFTHNLVRQIR